MEDAGYSINQFKVLHYEEPSFFNSLCCCWDPSSRVEWPWFFSYLYQLYIHDLQSNLRLSLRTRTVQQKGTHRQNHPLVFSQTWHWQLRSYPRKHRSTLSPRSVLPTYGPSKRRSVSWYQTYFRCESAEEVPKNVSVNQRMQQKVGP